MLVCGSTVYCRVNPYVNSTAYEIEEIELRGVGWKRAIAGLLLGGNKRSAGSYPRMHVHDGFWKESPYKL